MNPQLALLLARRTGQPVQIGNGLFAFPNGNIGPSRATGGFAANPQTWQPQLPVPPIPPANALASPAAAPLQPVNAALATPAPLGNTQSFAGLQGAAGGPSGAPQYSPTLPVPPVPPSWATPQMPPDVMVTARRYRGLHGMTASDDAATDQLNALSLQAAQQGRNYWNPQFAGPAFLAPNLLQAPPAAAAPIMLGQTGAAPTNVNFLANQQAQQLQQGGLY